MHSSTNEELFDYLNEITTPSEDTKLNGYPLDQNDNLFTQYNSRSGNELNAGSGKAKIIEGQSKWQKLVGAECFYSIRYLV